MEDIEIYGWKTVRDYHAVWLQQIEQWRASWGDKEKKTRFRRTLVWNRAAGVPKAMASVNSASWQSTQDTGNRASNGYFSPPSKPGDKACQAFNHGQCTDNSSLPLELYVCSYCLAMVQRLCKHMELYCQRKGLSAKAGAGGT